MSLPLVTRFGADPLLDLEIANKRYVDNSGGGGKTFAAITKSVEQIVNNSSTFVDDDELFFAATASKVYGFYLVIHLISGGTPDIKTKFTLPSGAVGTISGAGLQGGTAGASQDITVSDFHATNNTNQNLAFVGRIIMDTTAGNCNLQWAQNVATASNTKVLAGSYLIVWEIA